MRPAFPSFESRIELLSLTLLLAGSLACVSGGIGEGPVPPPPPPKNPRSATLAQETRVTTDANDTAQGGEYYGHALVTWNGKSSATSNSAIWARAFVPTSGWGGFGSIESLTGDAAGQKIAMNDEGFATVVWAQGTGTRSIQATRYSPTTGFSGVAASVSTGSQDAMTPAVAMDPSGNAVAAWVQSDGSHYHVWACRYLPLSGWGAPIKLDSNLTQEARNPAVAMDPSGNAVVTWHQSADLTHGPYAVCACDYWVGQGWSLPKTLQVGGDAWNPAIAMSRAGAQAVWSEITSSTTSRIYSSRYTTASDAWTTPVPVSSAGALADWPSVGIDQAGNGIVTWAEAVGTQSYAAMAVRYSTLTGWESTGSFDNGTSGAGTPVVSMNASGTAAIAWNRDDGTNLNLYAACYNQGWQPTFLVSPDRGGEAYSPSVSVGAYGDIWATWMQWDAGHQVYDVMASSHQ